ncbi:hypothetical protein ZIOFF_052625 [Zingiber officinale]|uniref:Uncharacterized protein n=1 Tax=Zingiber officinale TaxID=94328 RepID=A0A8J5FMF5_ZINOF|nr:hypothetical protein ZIOFF_052625 [Zingiber officinale]
MSGALDMSLDDIIKSSKKIVDDGRGQGREAGGPSRGAPNRTANRSAPYSSGKVRALGILICDPRLPTRCGSMTFTRRCKQAVFLLRQRGLPP